MFLFVQWKICFHSVKDENVPFNENILTIALINIHYLYSVSHCRWYEGEALLDWAGNFPVDYVADPKYDCVVMKVGTSGDGTWREVQCNEQHGFICEAAALP